MSFNEQGTEEWLEDRRGRFTSSEIFKLMGSRGFGDTAKTYVMEIVDETINGLRPPVTAKSMEWGHENEPRARAMYEVETGEEVTELGMIPFGDHAGVSLDGTVGEDKTIEIKCPKNRVNHTKNLFIKTLADFKRTHKRSGYYWQIQFGLMVTDRKSCDFVSFCPRSVNRLFIFNIKRNEEDIALIQERLDIAIEMKLAYLDDKED